MLRLPRQRRNKAIDRRRVGRQAEAQEIVCPVETAAPDVMLRETTMQRRRVRMARQPEQRCATDDIETSLRRPIHHRPIR